MKYGCHNTPRKDGFYARDLQQSKHFHIPSDGWKFLRDTSTVECQYRKTTPDPKCEGCTK